MSVQSYILIQTEVGKAAGVAKAVGASMTDIDWIQTHPTVGKDSRILISETVRGVGAIMVNKEGNSQKNKLKRRIIMIIKFFEKTENMLQGIEHKK